MPEFNPPALLPGRIHFASRLIAIDDHRNAKRTKFWIYCIANPARGLTYYACEPEFVDYAARAVGRGILPVFGGAS